jgi:hypothetical protein
MAQYGIHWIGRVLQLHPVLTYILGFLGPIAGAYWLFGVRPYRHLRPDRILTPWHVRRPAVPGVLERYASWEWAAESRLTPFGRWLFHELQNQDQSLLELLDQAGLDFQTVASVLYSDATDPGEQETVRRLASAAGADDPEIARLVESHRDTRREMNRLP